MRLTHAALIGGAAAIAGATATSVVHTGPSEIALPASTAATPLWSPPNLPCAGAGGNPRCWWARKGIAVLSRAGDGLAIAAVAPGPADAAARFSLRVPLGDPLLLGDAPVAVTLAYALVDRRGWVDARIDAHAADGQRRFEVIGALDGGGELRLLLPADAVRARGQVAIDVLLRIRSLAGGNARLMLRSVTLDAAL